MGCDCESHQMHICYLKSHGQDERVRALTSDPKVVCRQCGAQANSSEYLCAAHLKEDAPNVEGGHGSVGLDQVGKPHTG